MSLRRGLSWVAAAAVLAGGIAIGLTAERSTAGAATLPVGFQEQVVFSGLTQPTSIQFAADGRVFVAQKNGVIKVFASMSDPTPTVFADLSSRVHDYWDRGLLGFALAPNFPTDPSVYVLYSYDAPPGGTAPVYNDVCDSVEGGGNGGNCIITGRLSRLTANGNAWTGTEQPLINDWCQQYPSHSIGDLHFGADGALYVSGGDGANFNMIDYGQFGNPVNPCGDPAQEGGSLRSQDVRSTGDPTGLSGAVLRLDPATGAAMPGNPLSGSADANARRIVGYGLRNPFRFTIRPGTNEVWAGDVGWNAWEEINRIADPTATPSNFGWPCYEGSTLQPSFGAANLPLCQSAYNGSGQAAPYYAYNHSAKVVPGENCPTGSSSVSGLAFYPTSGGDYPAAYNGALFFADYSRNCIWAMPKGSNGLPDPTKIQNFVIGAATPVYLTIGPGNDLYYADLSGGTVRRIRYFPNNRPPVASFTATPASGTAPLNVTFDASSSMDQDTGDQSQLTYQWDFDNNGTFDATGITASHSYTANGTYTALLKVTDPLGASGTSTTTITAGNSSPTATIDSPAASLTWAVGNKISFSGHATDPQQGTLPASALKWEVLLEHCSSLDTCHTHYLQTFDGVASGSFTAPDHEYPSYLRLRLTATDSGGLTSVATVDLQPKTVDLSFTSKPSGLQIAVGSDSQATPFTRRVIAGSTTTVSAPTPQTAPGVTYNFGGWADGGAQTHTITAPATPATYTATYTSVAPIELRASANGSFVTAENGGNSPLIANRSVIGDWEQFDVADAGDGYVALRARANLRYVTAEAGGNSPLIANRTSIGDWEKFQMIDNGDGTISLKAKANGRYVTADNGGNSPLIANRTSIGAWEKFTKIKPPSRVSLTAQVNSRVITADNGGNLPLIANRTAVGPWEQFDLVDIGGGYVALLAKANGRYVTAENGGNSSLIANRTSIGDWEKFQIVDNGDGTIGLKAKANGRYVTAENGGNSPLIANRTAIGPWERFTLAGT
ncbi:PQQ-dependent sugar dehydrogenase [Dactylosporangium sp. CA-092794]|uniref:PQQ-dependent sugar dehydrogenase n=1 Tax=Dactylosporangium sp. CA-092794 TaxID=3239929 RepID=UPI003D90845D